MLTESSKEKLRKIIGQANYETTVKEEVRATNDEKVRSYDSTSFRCLESDGAPQMEKIDTEIETIRLAIERFQSLL